MITTGKTSNTATDVFALKVSRGDRAIMIKAFRLGVASILLLYTLSLETSSLPLLFVVLLMTCASLLPSYMWCSGRAIGLPIFPVFALTHIWTFTLPLLKENEALGDYTVGDKVYAGMTVAIYLFIATLVWLHFVKRAPKPVASYYSLSSKAGDTFLLYGLAGGVFFNMALVGGWLWIGGDVFGAARSALLASIVIGVFVAVCYRISRYMMKSRFGLLLSNAALIAVGLGMGYATYRFFSNLVPDDVNSIGGLVSTLRGVLLGFSGLAVFGLSYRMGTRQLGRRDSILFLLLLCLSMLSSAVSLMLVGALSVGALAVVGFTIGRRRIPWMALLLTLPVITFLNYGKSEMREKYWGEGEGIGFTQPWDYPGQFLEWGMLSYEHITRRQASGGEEGEDKSLTSRASLIQLLLLAQKETSRGTPFLYGETYIIIPQLLVPRFILPDKPWSHEGTYILNIHFGIQTREEVTATTIGWGLLNEAFANFGLLGCAALAVVLGAVFGKAACWSYGVPLLSFRFLFSILLMSFAYQSEFSASVFVTALFQSTMPLVALTLLLMKVQRGNQAMSISQRGWATPATA